MRGDLVDCDSVAEALPRILDGTRRSDRVLLRHAATCLRCQAELARYRRMLRLLHQLRSARSWSSSPLAAGTVLDTAGVRTAGVLALHAGHGFPHPGARPKPGAALAGRRQLAAALAAVTAVAGVGAAAVVAAASRSRPTARRGAPCGSQRLC